MCKVNNTINKLKQMWHEFVSRMIFIMLPYLSAYFIYSILPMYKF